MKTVKPMNALSKILMALAALLFAGLSLSAHAGDFMLDTDPTAPCGELHLIGHPSAIFNLSDFTFNVVFKTSAHTYEHETVNAGAVKYLERDERGNAFWRDTGIGDYRQSKTYAIPVKSKDIVTIAYCGSGNAKIARINGEVSFTADTGEAPHRSIDGNVAFTGMGFVRGQSDNPAGAVKFQDAGHQHDVLYNLNPYGQIVDGSIIIRLDE